MKPGLFFCFKWVPGVASTVLSLLFLAVSFAGSEEGAPRSGGELVFALPVTPSHLNAAIASGTAIGIPGAQLFASPLRFDENWKPQPYLAEKWEFSDDDLSLTLHLVKDATFHDGAPITSEDVAFSLMLVKDHHPFSSMFAAVERVDTPDPHTAIIQLSHPHPALLLTMSPYFLPILPRHVYGDGQDIRTHPANTMPVGSGPYRLKSYIAGKRIELVRFDNFFLQGRPYLDRITFITGKEGKGTLFLEMRHGKVHMQSYVMPNGEQERKIVDAGMVITDKGYQAIGPLQWLAFNLSSKPLDDVRVRRALAHAIDREWVVDLFYGGRAREATGPITPDSPFYSKDVPGYPYDIAKANTLLDAAGYPRGEDGRRFTLTVDGIPTTSVDSYSLLDYLRHEFAQTIGVEIRIRSHKDQPAWKGRISSWDFQATIDHVFNWGDPLIGVHRTYDSKNIRKGVMWSNTQQYSNPRIDELMALAGREPEPEKRRAYYAEFQRLVLEDLPLYPLVLLPYRTVHHPDLKGVDDNIWGVLSPLDRVYWANGDGAR